MVHSATNILDQNESKAVTDAIIKIGNVFQEKSVVVNIILTGFLPQLLNKSKQRNKVK